MPFWVEYTMDPRGVAALITVCLGSVMLFGLVPALTTSRVNQRSMLETGGRLATQGASARRWAGLFQSLQIGLAVLFGAAMLNAAQDYRALQVKARVVDPTDLMTLWWRCRAPTIRPGVSGPRCGVG